MIRTPAATAPALVMAGLASCFSLSLAPPDHGLRHPDEWPTSLEQRRSRRQLPPRPGPGGRILEAGRHGHTNTTPPSTRCKQAAIPAPVQTGAVRHNDQSEETP